MNQAIVKLHRGLPNSPHLKASAYLQLAQLYAKAGEMERASTAIQDAEKHLVVEEMDPREVMEISNFPKDVLQRKSGMIIEH